MSENIRSVPSSFFGWATTTEQLETPCDRWPQAASEKRKRKSKEQLRYELSRRYHSDNAAAARIIRNDPARYPGVMQEWAQRFPSTRRWSTAA